MFEFWSFVNIDCYGIWLSSWQKEVEESSIVWHIDISNNGNYNWHSF